MEDWRGEPEDEGKENQDRSHHNTAFPIKVLIMYYPTKTADPLTELQGNLLTRS